MLVVNPVDACRGGGNAVSGPHQRIEKHPSVGCDNRDVDHLGGSIESGRLGVKKDTIPVGHHQLRPANGLGTRSEAVSWQRATRLNHVSRPSRRWPLLPERSTGQRTGPPDHLVLLVERSHTDRRMAVLYRPHHTFSFSLSRRSPTTGQAG